MGCTGCNDDCFDESVQLQAGADGNDGSDGNDGAAGVDGVAIVKSSTRISSPLTLLGGGWEDVVGFAAGDVPVTGLDTAEDVLRIEVTAIGDLLTDTSSTTYSMRIKFGTLVIFEDQIGSAAIDNLWNGTKVTVDLVVVGTNNITARLQDTDLLIGDRATQFSIKKSAYAGPILGYLSGAHMIPTQDSAQTDLTPIAPDLSVSNDIEIQLKNSDGLATSEVSVISFEAYKLLK